MGQSIDQGPESLWFRIQTSQTSFFVAKFQFEFTPKQDAEFRQLVAKQRIAAIAIAVLVLVKAGGSLAGVMSANWQQVMFMALSFVASMYSCYALYSSSVNLYRITKSSGSDMGHLFAGLQGLQNCFAAFALAVLFNIIPDYLSS